MSLVEQQIGQFDESVDGKVEEEAKLSRKDLVEAMFNNWGGFLGQFRSLSSDEQTAYLQEQGYESLKDVLAHVNAWWDETQRVIPDIIYKQKPTQIWNSVEEFNKLVALRTAKKDEVAIEKEFYQGFFHMIDAITWYPEQNDWVYDWFYDAAVGHYEEHRLPVSQSQEQQT